MDNNTHPGSSGKTKEFYFTFGTKINDRSS